MYLSLTQRLVLVDLVNQKVATKLLDMGGHKVEVVDNGELAVAAATQNTYDLVLMDVSMPTMSVLPLPFFSFIG